MKHRIRVAGIIERDGKILLVKHVHPQTKFEWWVPPGGGVEDKDDSILDCVKREVFEETGLKVKVENSPVFIREFADKENDTLNLELFFKAIIIGGELTIDNIHGNGPDEQYIKDVKWLSLNEIQDKVVFPEELKSNFGKDVEKIYLGRQKD